MQLYAEREPVDRQRQQERVAKVELHEHATQLCSKRRAVGARSGRGAELEDEALQDGPQLAGARGGPVHEHHERLGLAPRDQLARAAHGEGDELAQLRVATDMHWHVEDTALLKGVGGVDAPAVQDEVDGGGEEGVERGVERRRARAGA